MRISKVSIKNFRSIKALEFYPQDICILVGENNAGKSNILSALSFLLGETWPSRRSIDRSDYYNEDTSRPIEIRVRFEDNPAWIQEVWCRIPWDPSVQTLTRVRRAGSRTDDYLSNSVRDSCALVYIDAHRNLEYHLGHSRWTLFGRIIQRLDDYFRGNASEASLQDLDTHFREIQGLLRTPLFDEFEHTFSANFKEQLRRTTHDIRVEFRPFDPRNYYRTLQAVLLEAEKAMNPAQAGQGMQNLVLLALFRTYAKVFKEDAFIAMEEPEIYLHPHSRRSLARSLDELVQGGNQVFFSTHSGDFIDIERFDRICLVEKTVDSDGDTATQVRQVSVRELLDKRQWLHPNLNMTASGVRTRYRNICRLEHNDAFFARKIVLVEGETEEYSLPIFASGLGYDLDAFGVSVVNAHGKNNLDQLYQLYDCFGFPIYLIFDNDRGGKQRSDLETNKTLLRMLGKPEELTPDGSVTEEYAVLEKNFEHQMQISLDAISVGKYQALKQAAEQELGNRSKGLVARHMAQALVDEQTIPDFIVKIITKIRSLGESTVAESSIGVAAQEWFREDDLYQQDDGNIFGEAKIPDMPPAWPPLDDALEPPAWLNDEDF